MSDWWTFLVGPAALVLLGLLCYKFPKSMEFISSVVIAAFLLAAVSWVGHTIVTGFTQ